MSQHTYYTNKDGVRIKYIYKDVKHWKSGYFFNNKEIIVQRSKNRGRVLTKEEMEQLSPEQYKSVVKVRNKPPKIIPKDLKIEACTLYAVLGDYNEVAKYLNHEIPINTLKQWSKEDWWVEIQKQVYVEQNDKLGATITEVLTKTLQNLLDRLEHGDTYIDQRGKTHVKPIDAKVLAVMFSTLATQRRLTRGEPTSISVTKQTTDSKLAKLQEEFIRFSQAKEIEILPDSEGETIDAIKS